MVKLGGHEIREPVCGHCRYYVVVTDAQGVCYFNPPVPYPVPAQKAGIEIPGAALGLTGIAVMPLRPPIALTERACSHFTSFPALTDDPLQALDESLG